MKRLLLTVLLLMTFLAYAQVGVGIANPSASSIVDFPANKKLGLLLPQNIKANVNAVAGTLIYDLFSGEVKYKNDTSWVPLSSNNGVTTNNFVGLPDSGKETVIGAKTSIASGVLVLEADDKALSLPVVGRAHEVIANPEAGTICYDDVNNVIAIFNGTEWSFWKKQ